MAEIDDIQPEDCRNLISQQTTEFGVSPALIVVWGRNVDKEVQEKLTAVQLLYWGLLKVDELATQSPWKGSDNSLDTDTIPADKSVIGAEIAVGRAMSLLTETEESDTAVEIVQEFASQRTRCEDLGEEFYQRIAYLCLTVRNDSPGVDSSQLVTSTGFRDDIESRLDNCS